MKKPILIGVLLMSAISGAQAEGYVRGSFGRAKHDLQDFRFVNPVGTAFTSSPTSGNLILMHGVDEASSSTTAGLALGFQDKGSPFRVEARLDHRQKGKAIGFATFPAGDFAQQLEYTSDSLMLFGFHDWKLAPLHEVSVGLGLGYSRNRSKGYQGANLGWNNSFPEQTQSEPAWGLGIGYAYQMDTNWKLDLDAAYLNLGQVDTGTTNAAWGPVVAGNMNAGEKLRGRLISSEVRIGLRYSFK